RRAGRAQGENGTEETVAPSNRNTRADRDPQGDVMKDTPGVVLAFLLLALTCVPPPSVDAAPKPVNAGHPRLLLTAADKARLLAKKSANDSSWAALKARADTLATYPIY